MTKNKFFFFFKRWSKAKVNVTTNFGINRKFLSQGIQLCKMKALSLFIQKLWSRLSLLWTDRRTDGQTDRVIPIYPQNFVCGGIKNTAAVSSGTSLYMSALSFYYCNFQGNVQPRTTQNCHTNVTLLVFFFNGALFSIEVCQQKGLMTCPKSIHKCLSCCRINQVKLYNVLKENTRNRPIKISTYFLGDLHSVVVVQDVS